MATTQAAQTLSVQIPTIWAILGSAVAALATSGVMWALARRAIRLEFRAAVREALDGDPANERARIKGLLSAELDLLGELHGLPAALESIAKTASESTKMLFDVRIEVARIQERTAHLEGAQVSSHELAAAVTAALLPHLPNK